MKDPNEEACGNCRWYKPATNPQTGRQLPSQDGKCNYSVIWPDLPKSFNKPDMPRRTPVWRGWRLPCVTWEAKPTKAKKAQAPLPLED